MHRFYLPPEQWSDADQILLINDAKQLHHTLHVVRLKKGEIVEIFDGMGRWAKGMCSIRGKSLTIVIQEIHQEPAPPQRVLICALPKRGLFNSIVEHAVSFGVTQLIPTVSRHSDVRPPPNNAQKMVARWWRIAIETARQSGRRWLPLLHPPHKLAPVLERLILHEAGQHRCLASLRAQTGLWSWLDQSDVSHDLIGAVGPEGDWTKEEESLFERWGFTPVHLGQGVLRVEAAAITIMAAFMLRHETAT